VSVLRGKKVSLKKEVSESLNCTEKLRGSERDKKVLKEKSINLGGEKCKRRGEEKESRESARKK
jgi:hypothetical protein